jgi:tetratricopeptide (TPR) repeat protein
MKSFEDALNALKEVEKRNPDYPGLALEQGRVLEFSGRVDKALSAYKKALSQSPDNTSLKLRVGVASHLIGDMETARKQLLSVLEETPSSPEANFYLGEIHRISGTVTEGIVHLQKACDLDPDNALYKLRYGLALKDMGENTKAMAALQEAIKRDQKMAEAYVAIGQIRLIQGGPRDAIYWVERGLQFNPNLKQGYITVAEAYEQISKMSSAAHYYRKASEVDKENATVHFKLGMAEMTVHGQKSAAVPLGKAVALVEKQAGAKPHWYPEALYRLGMAEKARSQRAAAIAAFKRYLEVAPENHIDRFEVRANLDELEH